MKRTAVTIEREMRSAAGWALPGGEGTSPAQLFVRPAYRSNVSRGSAVV